MSTTEEHTFLFADLAGFTALTEAHGDSDAAELASEFCQLVRELLPGYQAEEVKTIGDALMVRCRDPGRAIELGLRIVNAVDARPQFPIVRVGMHSGTAVERGSDWFGAAVNLAARVSAAAGGNEVLITAATRQAAGELPGVELRDRGQQRFKNIGEPVTVYLANRQGEKAKAPPVDPVCRMAIDTKSAAETLNHKQRKYYFCSLDCAQAFTAEPERYVAH